MEHSNLMRESEERSKCLHIFPSEIWIQILEQVKCPYSLASCAESASYFKQVLEPVKNIYLFPKILKYLDDRCLLESQDQVDKCDIINSILKCRLVCKGWRISVDQFLENRHHQQSRKASNFYYETKYSSNGKHPSFFINGPAFRLSNFDFNENNILGNAVLSHDISSGKKTFPSRLIIIDDNHGRPSNVFMNSLSTLRFRTEMEVFLGIFGTHFWHAQIAIGHYMSVLEWYKLLIKFVQCMPNLKSLYITKIPMITAKKHNFSDLYALPFPSLNNLEVLKMMRNPAINSILAANPNVKLLEIFDYSPTHSRQYEIINWGQVGSSEGTTSFLISTNSALAEFIRMPETWRLQELRVAFEIYQDSLNWSEIFKKLECYRDTLTELSLVLPPVSSRSQKEDAWNISKKKLNLPKLKKFQVHMFECFSWDFLLGLESLDHLSFHFVNDCGSAFPGNSKRVINISKDTADDFAGSHIWEIIPTLQTVTKGKTWESKCYKRPGSGN